MAHIGIVGGGPGGLMTAHLLGRRLGSRCRITLLEASEHLGGKLRTQLFRSAPVPYEAGAAEIYDYSRLGRDPLNALLRRLALETRPMAGHTIVLRGTVLRDDADIERHWGAGTLHAIRAFRAAAARSLPLERWHPGCWRWEEAHPWARGSWAQLLDTIEDPVARRYVEISAHPDLATEPHLTTGLYGLENFVLDVPGYVELRSVDGGMTRIAEELAARMPTTRVVTGARVERVARGSGGTWRLTWVRRGRRRMLDCDAVVLALPASHLGIIEYEGARLARAMGEHVRLYDRPGHYLRVSLLFRRPFWRGALTGSWFVLDAFGGACVYDESARYDTRGYGVLGFLIAGSHALAMMGEPEGRLAGRVIQALPGGLARAAADTFVEAHVHRWCGGVSAQPGGLPRRSPEEAHHPGGRALPGLHVVGDYLFDSTLNAVLRSARVVARSVGRALHRGAAPRGTPRARPAAAVAARPGAGEIARINAG